MATSAIVIQQKVGRVADLLELRFGLAGPTLRDRVQKARRHLPADLRRAAERLSEAEAMALQPRLLLAVNEEVVDRDYRLLVKRLESASSSPAEQSFGRWLAQSLLGAAASLAVLGFAFLGWTLSH